MPRQPSTSPASRSAERDREAELDAQKHFYDDHFSRPLAEAHRQDDFKDAFLERALGHADIRPGDRVLELGCGDGIFTRMLLARGAIVTAINLSPQAIASLREQLPEPIRAGWLRAEAAEIDEYLEARGEPFARIVGSGILHHLTDLPRTAKLMRARLAEGGAAFFAPEPNGGGLYGQLWRYAAPPLYRLYGGGFDWEVEKRTLEITRPKLTSAFHGAGFASAEFWPFQVIPHFRSVALRALDQRLVRFRPLNAVALCLAVRAST